MNEKSVGRLSGSSNIKYWLITRHEKGGMEVLTLDSDDGGSKETLPVFSFQEEAEMFLRFEASEDGGWRARESTIGELALVLLGLCAGVERVALDPLPVRVGGEAMVGLVSLGRQRFLLNLMDEYESSTSSWRPSREHRIGFYSHLPLRRCASGGGFVETEGEDRNWEVHDGG